MSDLVDALDRVSVSVDHHGQVLSGPDVLIIVDAARKYANIHPSRLHEWHILHIKPGSWGLTHPLDCDLTDCAYQTHAETWDEPPDELGNYQWEHEPVLESWVGVSEDE